MKGFRYVVGVGALLAIASAAPANAQFGIGPRFRPLGPQGVFNLGGYGTPMFSVNAQGIRPGYLGPNGPYAAPGYGYGGAPVGSLGTSNLYSPLSPTGTFGDPSQVEVYGASGQAPATPQIVPGAIPRSSDSIEARIDKDNRLVVHWNGDASAVARIRFALLDKDKNVLKEELVKKLPAQATLAITSKTSYYQVYVEYVNGVTTNVISPL